MNAAWQHTRLIVYTLACTVTKEEDRQDIYDFLPLKGDPTPEQRKAVQKATYEKMLKQQADFTEQLRKEKADKK